MSTRRKRSNGSGFSFIASFLAREPDMGEHRHSMMLTTRLGRNMLETGDGTAEIWIEMAGVLNVCGLYATKKARADWIALLQKGGDAMREVEARHRRVGGRYAANAAETAAITAALNVMDVEILPAMPLIEFVHEAERVNRMNAEYFAAQDAKEAT
mgnify:CR=1 FL=1